MESIFTSKSNAKVYPDDNVVRYHKTTNYGDEILNILGPKIWNHLPSNMQSETTLIIALIKFEELLIHGLELNVNVAL